MTREDIKNAAKEHQSKLPYCDDRKVRGEFVGNYYGFIAGAQWRINSVWHDNSIRPGEDCDVLVETKRGIEMDRYDIDYNELDNGTDWESDVIRWAYVDDLLPERKEETK